MSMDKPLYIAHVRKNPDGTFVEHSLEEHLRGGFAILAGRFAGNGLVVTAVNKPVVRT